MNPRNLDEGDRFWANTPFADFAPEAHNNLIKMVCFSIFINSPKQLTGRYINPMIDDILFIVDISFRSIFLGE